MIYYKFGILLMEIAANLVNREDYFDLTTLIIHQGLYARLEAEVQNKAFSVEVDTSQDVPKFYGLDILIVTNPEYKNKYSFARIV